MSLTSQFKTDGALETKGIVLDYGETRVRVARAGGANKKFAKQMTRETRPYRRAIATGSFSDEKANDLLRKVFAETCVLGWETKVGDKWEPGIDPTDLGKPKGDLLPASKENIAAVFVALPEFFTEVIEQARNQSLYRAEIDEALAGN